MRCPHCSFLITAILGFPDDEKPNLCIECMGIVMITEGVARKATAEEIARFEQWPGWDKFLEVARAQKRARAARYN
jgi:hypothetical protein